MSGKNLIDTGFLNMAYFYPSSVKSSVSFLRLYVDEPVDRDRLLKAVENVMPLHWYYTLKPVLDEKGRVFLCENDNRPHIYDDDGTLFNLGTADTDGYLFRVMAGKNTICLSEFHVISDGRGRFSFLATLLYEYFRLGGENIEGEDLVLTEEKAADPGARSQLLEDIPRNLEPQGLYMPENSFFIPGERTLITTPQTREDALVISAAQFRAYAKEQGGSQSAVLMALIGRMLCDHYDVGEQVISASLPVDMRALLKKNALSNYCGTANVLFEPSESAEPLPVLAERLTQRLRSQMTMENLCAGLYPLFDIQELMRNLPLSDPKINDKRINSRIEKEKHGSPVSYILTNVGRFPLPSGVEKHLEDFDVGIHNTGGAPLLGILTLKDQMHLTVFRNYETEELIEMLENCLDDCGISCSRRPGFLYTGDEVRPYLFERS